MEANARMGVRLAPIRNLESLSEGNVPGSYDAFAS
jgi:hypothetical protein